MGATSATTPDCIPRKCYSRLGRKARLVRAPFFYGTCYILFLMYYWTSMSMTVQEYGTHAKELLQHTCFRVQKVANSTANVATTATTAANLHMLKLVNGAIDKGFQNVLTGGEALYDIMFWLGTRLVKTETCMIVTFSEVGEEIAANFRDHALTEIAKQTDTINSNIDHINNELRNFISSVGKFFGAGGKDKLSHIGIPQMPRVPTDFSTTINMGDLVDTWEEQLKQSMNPFFIFQEQIRSVKLPVITDAVFSVPPPFNLSFCDDVSLHKLDEIVDFLVFAINMGIVALLGIFLLSVTGKEVHEAWLLRREERLLEEQQYGRFSSATIRDRLRWAARFAFHKPSLYCIALGIVGIALSAGQLAALEMAQKEYQRSVVPELTEFSVILFDQINAGLNETSMAAAANWNNAANDVEHSMLSLSTAVQDGLNQLLVPYTKFTEDFKREMKQVPVVGRPASNFATCMVPIKYPFLDKLQSALVLNFTMPRLDDDFLCINLDSIRESITEELLSVGQRFLNWYGRRLHQGLIYFIFGLVFGCIVPIMALIGFVFFVLRDRKRRYTTVS